MQLSSFHLFFYCPVISVSSSLSIFPSVSVSLSRSLFVALSHSQGKRRHRRPRWSNIRTKRRKLTEGEEAEGWGRKGGEGESEGERDSEESFKSGEIPSEDACSHCGLPNHPELVKPSTYTNKVFGFFCSGALSYFGPVL